MNETEPLRRTSLAMRSQAGVLGLMTVGGLTVSYKGLLKVAEGAQVPVPEIWPLLVDGLGISMSLAIWDARRDGQRAWAAKVVLVLVTAMSAVIQAGTSPTTDWSARTVHAWPPVIVFIAFEFFLWTHARHDRRAATVATTSDLPVSKDGATPAAPARQVATVAPAPIERPRSQRRAATARPAAVRRVPPSPEVLHQAVADVVRAGQDPTMERVAELINVSTRTLRRYTSADAIRAMAADVEVEPDVEVGA
jgi:hypothetical protein